MESREIKMLLIEDDSVDAELVKIALLRSGSSVALHWERTLASGIARLNNEPFDIVLSDLSLPDCVGRETIARIRNNAKDTPIVVMTDLDDSSVESELLEFGAQDYLVKGDMTGVRLKRAIRHSMQRHENVARIRDLLGEVEAKNELLRKKNEKLGKLFNQAHEFVDNVSHEFRTPLTVVKEYVSLVREGLAGEINPEQHRLLQVAEDRADDLNTMVEDMLDVSKLEAGMLGAWRKNCTLGDVIDHVQESLDRKASVKGVRLSWNLDDELPLVYCDAEKAGRVITNLVVNAIKFCRDPGLVSITANADTESQQIRVSITDNGPGIDRDGLASIFKRFKQLDHSVRSSTKGFGLGLGIAKELVELNFGQIDVESELHSGSTFSFTIPFAEPLQIIKRYLPRLDRVEYAENDSCPVSVINVTITQYADENLEDDVDAFLNYCLRTNDLLFRVNKHQWIVVLPEPESEVPTYLERVQNELTSVNRNRPFGPLPEINMLLAGCWSGKTQEAQILNGVQKLMGLAPPSTTLVTRANTRSAMANVATV